MDKQELLTVADSDYWPLRTGLHAKKMNSTPETKAKPLTFFLSLMCGQSFPIKTSLMSTTATRRPKN